jgi:hypothetical protein
MRAQLQSSRGSLEAAQHSHYTPSPETIHAAMHAAAAHAAWKTSRDFLLADAARPGVYRAAELCR